MKKVLAIMIASLVFFWAQPSAAQVGTSAGSGNLPPAPVAARAATTHSATADAPPPLADEWANAASTYGLLALGLLAVALRRQQLMQRWAA